MSEEQNKEERQKAEGESLKEELPQWTANEQPPSEVNENSLDQNAELTNKQQATKVQSQELANESTPSTTNDQILTETNKDSPHQPLPKPETPNSKHETPMEVHHHGHVHHEKKWKEYLFQFFMLFLAVFCGFLAEYQLEHVIENDREKQFIQSLIEDLQQDRQTLETHINQHEKSDVITDSLIKLLKRPDLNNTSELYYYGRVAGRNRVLASSRRTIEQMQNSGGFRLIRNSEAAKRIIAHYNQFDLIRRIEDIELNHQNEYRAMAIKAFDPEVMATMIGKDNIITRPKGNPLLRTDDQNLLTDLAGWVQYMKTSRIALRTYKNDLMQSGTELISFLEQEYHLK
jgi:hypothetical protein